MTPASLGLLALKGLLVAIVPLCLVWMSSDANKYRKLVWASAFLVFDLIVFGAFTRLTDSGLGCPDWPGCYGLANPFLAHEQIAAAEAVMPTGPVTVVKAWIEMTHRYLAMGVGFVSIALAIAAWRVWRRKRDPVFSPGWPLLFFVGVCVQGAFGAWTVTLKLQPIIVTIHLVLAMALLSMLVVMGERQNRVTGLGPLATALATPGTHMAMPSGLRMLAVLAAVVLAVQIALGGWVSTNYATLACPDFPLCQGSAWPDMDFEHGFTLWRELGKTAAGHYIPFSALTAIHWVHRHFALVAALVLGLAAWHAWHVAPLARVARGLAAMVVLQALTGVATVYLSFPLTIAVLHNAGAALLVVLVTMLNYRTRHLPVAARPRSRLISTP
jgi:cytochrome c oxidase assembly protein subunit 15